MDFSIRLRTAEDDLADVRASLKGLVTPPNSAFSGRQAGKRHAQKLISMPPAQASNHAIIHEEATHGNR